MVEQHIRNVWAGGSNPSFGTTKIKDLMKKKLEFYSEKKLSQIFKILNDNGANSRVVGGAVRDALLGIKSPDIDIATEMLPDDIYNLFLSKGYKTVPTGINHGTVSVFCGEVKFEITTLRKDIKTYGRHAEVKFTDDFKEDALRRDFTINALSYDFYEEKIYDYFNGLQDLDHKIVRFIGNPADRIQEDYLRILRFFRFSTYYSNELDSKGFIGCKKYASMLLNISPERVNQELSKILLCKKNISYVIRLMNESGVLEIIFSDQVDITGILNFEEKSSEHFNVTDNVLALRLAFLLFTLGRNFIRNLVKTLRFNKKTITHTLIFYDFICKIIDSNDKKEIYLQICMFWYYHGEYIKDILYISFVLSKIEFNELKANYEKMKFAAPKMPILSEELKKDGYSGINLGIRKKYLEKKWIESGFSIPKDELIKLKEGYDIKCSNQKTKK